MGLLNQILGGLAGGAMGRSPMGMDGGGGMNRVVTALLPVVLSMLANRQHGGSRGGSFPGMGGMGGMSRSGGMGGMGGLGGLGGLAGMGGLGALLEMFSQRGYSQHANSWVSTGPNQPLSPDAVSDVFEPQQLAEIAAQAGVTEEEARMGLAEILPEAVDHFTPTGQLPSHDQLDASIEDYVRQLPR